MRHCSRFVCIMIVITSMCVIVIFLWNSAVLCSDHERIHCERIAVFMHAVNFFPGPTQHFMGELFCFLFQEVRDRYGRRYVYT